MSYQMERKKSNLPLQAIKVKTSATKAIFTRAIFCLLLLLLTLQYFFLLLQDLSHTHIYSTILVLK